MSGKLSALADTLRFVRHHPFNRDAKNAAVLRFLRWQIGSRLVKGDIIIPFVDNSVLAVSNGMTGATGNIYVGLDEYKDMGFVLHMLRHGEFFADVGANIGSYSILAATAGAQVIAFEPIPATFTNLTRNSLINDFSYRLDCRNLAIGAVRDTLRMTADEDTMNHMTTSDDAGAPFVDIPVDTLDAQLAGQVPSVMKIDVEGFEMEVIKGAEATFANTALRAVVVELNGNGQRYGVSDEDVHDKLTGFGLTPCTYDPFNRQIMPLDVQNAPRGNRIYVRDMAQAAERLRSARQFRIRSVDRHI